MSDAEKFLKELAGLSRPHIQIYPPPPAGLPRLREKHAALSYMLRFDTRVAEACDALDLLTNGLTTFRSFQRRAVSDAVMSSARLKTVFHTILEVGNFLNAHTSRGAAAGFKLATLQKLSEVRANDNKMTLLHYLAQLLRRHHVDALAFAVLLACQSLMW